VAEGVADVLRDVVEDADVLRDVEGVPEEVRDAVEDLEEL